MPNKYRINNARTHLHIQPIFDSGVFTLRIYTIRSIHVAITFSIKFNSCHLCHSLCSCIVEIDMCSLFMTMIVSHDAMAYLPHLFVPVWCHTHARAMIRATAIKCLAFGPLNLAANDYYTHSSLKFACASEYLPGIKFIPVLCFYLFFFPLCVVSIFFVID